ncbi:MAG: LamB/YcsF family protein [Clostridia bacterium]|nr:LamB/YcsF family protein [Clostridia bacterium]
MRSIDLNSDLGESFGVYTIGTDRRLMRYITSASVACGWHAGDPVVMRETVAAAKACGIGIGAHPGYQDLMGFGRREMKLTPVEVYSYVLYQLGALYAFLQAADVHLQHLKPHGALYNQACKDEQLAGAICRAVKDFDRDIIILAPYASAFRGAAEALDLPFAAEFFADRAYQPDGSLVPRVEAGAVIRDPALACKRVLQMAQEGTVECMDGTILSMRCASICVHGDNETALETVRLIRSTLEQNGISLRPIKELL